MTNLFSEMEKRYWKKPITARTIKNGKSYPLGAKIDNVARYFSAYKIEKDLIRNIEALLTRVITNSASNFRVESFTN